MSRGMPSMTALLALLAIAGYQNRDKIAEMLGGGKQPTTPDGRPPQGAGSAPAGGGGILDGLGGLLGGASAGSILGGGLGELLDSFRKNGQGDTADSWVNQGPNREIAPPDLEKAIGADTLDTLSRETGLSREELLKRLSRELPSAVDRYTPDGKLPSTF